MVTQKQRFAIFGTRAQESATPLSVFRPHRNQIFLEGHLRGARLSSPVLHCTSQQPAQASMQKMNTHRSSSVNFLSVSFSVIEPSKWPSITGKIDGMARLQRDWEICETHFGEGLLETEFVTLYTRQANSLGQTAEMSSQVGPIGPQGLPDGVGRRSEYVE